MIFSLTPKELRHFKVLSKQPTLFDQSMKKLVMRIGILAILLLNASAAFLLATPANSQDLDKVEITLELKNESLFKLSGR